MQLAARPPREAEAALDDVLAGIEGAAAQSARIAVLPEASVPGYVLLSDDRRAARLGAQAVEAVRAAARRAGICVAFGVVGQSRDGTLRNEAVFVDRRGDVVARYAKMFLWGFDGRWFSPGRDVPAFDTEFGTVGMMICADGRMPEVARTLALRGAWLVLDPTAWVAVGRTYAAMRNPQVDFVLGTRARENGIWIAAADKCGSEHAAVHYVGRSRIVDPDGAVAVEAGASEPAIVAADVSRRVAAPFVVALDALEARALRSRRTGRSGEPTGRVVHIGILQGPLRTGRTAAVAALHAQGAIAVVDTGARGSACLAPLRKVPSARFAEIRGRRMCAPEPARAAALRGADVLVWTDPPSSATTRLTARTRALESKVFVIVCARVGDPDPACAIDPTGAVIGEALQGEASGFVAAIDVRASRDKLVVPGTDAFAARFPAAYSFASGGRR